MSFRRDGNRHGVWRRFCRDNAALLAEADVPEAVAHAEHRFRELLHDGATQAGPVVVTLGGLGIQQWAALCELAGRFFREFESWAPMDLFPGFWAEGVRREGGEALSRRFGVRLTPPTR